MNGLTLITPTGGRPESLSRCSTYVSRFKHLDIPVQWIVIDDVDVPEYRSTLQLADVELTLLSAYHRWGPGQNTLALNLLACIPEVKYDSVLFIEDDDWYSPEYASVMYSALQSHELVGEVPSRYYHVPSKKYRLMENKHHASLCQTGMRSSALPFLKKLCEESSNFIDIRLWRSEAFRKHTLNTEYCVGMKGLPGRPGIGIGHKPAATDINWRNDFSLTMLSYWIGKDTELYAANLPLGGRCTALPIAG